MLGVYIPITKTLICKKNYREFEKEAGDIEKIKKETQLK